MESTTTAFVPDHVTSSMSSQDATEMSGMSNQVIREFLGCYMTSQKYLE